MRLISVTSIMRLRVRYSRLVSALLAAMACATVAGPAFAEAERLGTLDRSTGAVRIEREGEPGFRIGRPGGRRRGGSRGKALHEPRPHRW